MGDATRGANEENNRARSVATDAALKLLEYCRSRDWAGIDPYDSLNSRLFRALPILDRRIPRLVLTQAIKRSPINIRPLLMVEPKQNSKALGLFLQSALLLSNLGLAKTELAETLATRLKELRSPNTSYWCWGYSFPWQTRTLLVPANSPNLVCTTFVANAFLDAYEQLGDASHLDVAASGAQYILNDLYWTDGGSVSGFAYPLPTMRNNVHNGNLLGAALLCRVAKHTGDRSLIDAALKVARFSASRQRGDGSWAYGESANQDWIDNFHTGYNLEALRSIQLSLKSDEFDGHIRKGFGFYRSHFFREDGAPRYFHDRTYPIDIHAVAESLIALVKFSYLDPSNIPLARKVLQWTMKNMWDDRGFFYYRVLRAMKIRTSYMRWSQAWMLLALSTFLSESGTALQPSPPMKPAVLAGA
jgi:hypothetical protein